MSVRSLSPAFTASLQGNGLSLRSLFGLKLLSQPEVCGDGLPFTADL